MDSPQLRAPGVRVHMPLSPSQCARLRAVGGQPGHGWLTNSVGTLVYASQPFESAVDVWAPSGKKFKAAGVLALAPGSVPLGPDGRRRAESLRGELVLRLGDAERRCLRPRIDDAE